MPKIIVRRDGALVGTFTVTSKSFIIGAAQNCAVSLEDVGLPPHAAEVTAGESGYTLKRLSPIPDLRVNLAAVDQYADLADCDEIKLDDYVLIFNLLEEELAPPAPAPSSAKPEDRAELPPAQEVPGPAVAEPPPEKSAGAGEGPPSPALPPAPPPAARAEPPPPEPRAAPPPSPVSHPKTRVSASPPPPPAPPPAPEPPPASREGPASPPTPPGASSASGTPPAGAPKPGRKTKILDVSGAAPEAESRSAPPASAAPPSEPRQAAQAPVDREATQFMGGALEERLALLAIGGPLQGDRHVLKEGETRIGRDPQNDIVIRFDRQGEIDTSVSRLHCVITREGGQYILRDPKSKTRTMHNGRVLKPEESVILAHGDTIEVRSLQENSAFHVVREGEWEVPERVVREEARSEPKPWWKRFLPGGLLALALLGIAWAWSAAGTTPDAARRITFSSATPWPVASGIRSASGAFLSLGDSLRVLVFATSEGDVEWLSRGERARPVLLGLKASDLPFLSLDIDLDGNDDLLCISDDQRIYAYDGLRGSRLGGTEWFAEAYGSALSATRNATLGVLISSHSDGGKFAAYRAKDAQVFRRELYYNGRTMGHGVYYDCDADGFADYVAGTDDGQVIWIDGRSGQMNTVNVHALATASDPELGSSALQIRAAVAHYDYTADGYAEWILLSRQGHLLVFDRHNGRLLAHYSFDPADRKLPRRYPGPMLADLNLDGIPEIIVAPGGAGLYAFRTPGTAGEPLVELWPPVGISAPVWEPALVDLNGDRAPEIVIAGGDGELVVVDGERGETLYRAQVQAQGPPLVSDVDLDGDLEILAAAGQEWAVVATDATAPGRAAWPQWRGEPSRNGYFAPVPPRKEKPWGVTVALTAVALFAAILWVKL